MFLSIALLRHPEKVYSGVPEEDLGWVSNLMFSHNNGGLCGEFGVVQLFGPIVNMVRAVFAFSVLNWEHLTPLVVVRVFQTFVSMDAAREEFSFLLFFFF